MRPILIGVALLAGALIDMPCCRGADVWGGSIAVTSDYLVRGVSRSNDQAALQLDLHYLNRSGFVAGVFASNTQIDPGESRDAELDAFVGFAWAARDLRGKILATHYAYPWNALGSRYDYDELDLDLNYRDWLGVTLDYSPNAPRYVRFRGLTAVTAKSVEVNLQRPVLRRLSVNLGLGYYSLGGPETTGYGYGSLGAAYDIAPVLLTLSYVKTTAEAKSLFYNAEVGGRWTGTVIWRF